LIMRSETSVSSPSCCSQPPISTSAWRGRRDGAARLQRGATRVRPAFVDVDRDRVFERLQPRDERVAPVPDHHVACDDADFGIVELLHERADEVPVERRVGVERHEELAAREPQTEVRGRGPAHAAARGVVADQADLARARVGQHFRVGPIGAVVVDDQDLEVRVVLIAERAHALADGLGFVAAGHHDRHERQALPVLRLGFRRGFGRSLRSRRITTAQQSGR
jgi:hypothetical protein